MSCDSDMIPARPTTRYSADVEIELFMDGRRFSVGQIGRGVLIFDQPVQLPSATGQLVLTIDGHARRWNVAIRNGHAPAQVIPAEFHDCQ